MPSDLVMKTMNTMHRTVLKISVGRIGWRAGNMPALELTTTGRKSGQPRTSMLTSPWQDGDTLAIVASAGGNDTHPAWFLNLRDHPEVEVRTEKGTRKMNARIASGDERSELWGHITAEHDNYAGYQTKTDREIPVVVLEPVE